MNKSPPHIVLGIAPDASDDEIKKTYRRLAKKWHPDRYQGSKKYGEEQFKRILSAHETMLSSEYKDKRNTNNTNNTNIPSRGFQNNQYPFGVHPRNINHQPQNQPQNQFQMRPPNTFTHQTYNQRRPVTGSASVLCNGTVLLSWGLRPSQMTPELLRHLQNTTHNTTHNSRFR